MAGRPGRLGDMDALPRLPRYLEYSMSKMYCPILIVYSLNNNSYTVVDIEIFWTYHKSDIRIHIGMFFVCVFFCVCLCFFVRFLCFFLAAGSNPYQAE